ncbi:STAS domain-containing protein [Mycobacterium asiaticum]|uniref:Sulfate transporter n=1 Tax=Mycobacterium asiaticum TaxID=1790 RepID=A0A1A3KH05_MYCAS|nr:STAS domain-containing protein [Mycobacterium asiaticum]OBJ84305.1 sulfate transporter [Mycobacterium asiaticum]
MSEPRAAILIDVEERSGVSIVVTDGVLDYATYRGLRDTVIKAALDEPRAVIVDVNRLSVPSPSAWSVFTSARWHVSTWPNVPILLACSDIDRQCALTTSAVARYVPVHTSLEAALDAVDDLAVHGRRRARAALPRSRASIRLARGMIHEWLTTWSVNQLIPVAGTVATVFIENVLEHTESEPVLVVENFNDTLTVAVEDRSRQPVNRREDAAGGIDAVSGLAIVGALCRAWGSTPTSSGKTVWAVIGSENEL